MEDRIRSGEIDDKHLYDAVLELTGSEDVAAEALFQRTAAKTRAGLKVDI